jgi:hypothetical protein
MDMAPREPAVTTQTAALSTNTDSDPAHQASRSAPVMRTA